MSDNNQNEKFTKSTRMALEYAEEEARRFQHSYMGAEHLLLGLLHDRSNYACRLLFMLNVDPENIQKPIEAIVGNPDRQIPGEMPVELRWTPRAKKVLQLADDESRRLPPLFVQTENVTAYSVDTDSLLIGLIREGEGIASGMLESVGVDLKSARRAAVQIHTQETQNSSAAADSTEEATDTELTSPIEPVQKRRTAVVETTSQQPYKIYAFTEQAHRILEQAEDRALHLDHSYIGSEHLLLGIMDVSKGAGSVVLYNLGIEPKRFHDTLVYIVGTGQRFVDRKINLTPRSHRILQSASSIAKTMNNNYVGSEHLLLGIIDENGGIALGILENLGVDKALVLAEMGRVLKEAAYQ